MAVLKKYKTKTKRIGSLVGKNSLGHLILEMEGTNGSVENFYESELTRIFDYTFTAIVTGRAELESGSTGITDLDLTRFGVWHYHICKKGQVAVGDILKNTEGYLLIVMAIDTEVDDHKGTFEGVKLNPSPF